ncbi:MAG: hypothetical protein VB862_08435, partial [Pirellulaceae bacterium]
MKRTIIHPQTASLKPHSDNAPIFQSDITPIFNVVILTADGRSPVDPENLASCQEKQPRAVEISRCAPHRDTGPSHSGTKNAISTYWTEGLHEAAYDEVRSPPHGLSGKVISMPKMPLRSMALTGLTAVLFFLFNLAALNLTGLAQEETLPPQPGSEATQEQPEVLTRGPVHEAFAEQINNNPAAGVLIPKAPPQPIGEVPPEFKPEGQNVIWIPGYWSWDDEREDHIWVSGVWRVPPQDRRWVPGYWHQSDGGYHWVSGFWISTSQASVQYQQTPPLSIERGPTSVAPDENHFWVPGCWRYGTTYRWRPGYWRPFRADWIWIPAHYIWTPRGTVFVDGYWDYRMPRRGQLFAPVYIRHHRHRHAHYRYSPSCVINLGSIGMHLFVRPSYHHYYFGDYYGATYSSRNFYASFRFHGSGFGCDPFLTYYQWHFGRQGINYSHRLHQSHAYYARHQHHRPARTLKSQTNIIVNQQNNTNANINVLGRSLRDAARDTKSPQKLVRLANEQRTRHNHDLQQLRDISSKRHDHERSHKRLPASKQAQQDGPGKTTVTQAARPEPRKDLALPPVRPNRHSTGSHSSSHGEELRRKLAEQKSTAKTPAAKTSPARPTPQKVSPGKITRPAITSNRATPIVGPLPSPTTTARPEKSRTPSRTEERRRKLAEQKSAAKPPAAKTSPARPTPQKVSPGKITRPAITSNRATPIVGPLPTTTARPEKSRIPSRAKEPRRKLAEQKSAARPPAAKTSPARPTPQKVSPGKLTRPAITSNRATPIVGPLPSRTTRPSASRQAPTTVRTTKTLPAVTPRVRPSVAPARSQPAPTASRGASITNRQVPSRTPARTAPATRSRTASPTTSRSNSLPGRSSSVTRPVPSTSPKSSLRRSVPSSSRSVSPRSAPVRKSVTPAPTSRKTTSRSSSSRIVGPLPSSSSRSSAPRAVPSRSSSTTAKSRVHPS